MEDPVAAIRDALDDVAHRLTQAAAKDELLAELTQRRLMFGLVRQPVFTPVARVWRLGVLLLTHDGTAYSTGEITRATSNSTRQNYQSPAAEQRRGYRTLALRSGVPNGETVNFNAPIITLEASALRESSEPLFLRDGQPFVRWSHSLGGEVTMNLDSYLNDRVELLVHPPEGT
jgi:hypothetical protein